MSNREGYPDRTAEVAIANVFREQEKEKKNGDKRCPKTEEGKKTR